MWSVRSRSPTAIGPAPGCRRAGARRADRSCFTLRDAIDALPAEDMKAMLDEQAEAARQRRRRRFGFYFNCAGRGSGALRPGRARSGAVPAPLPARCCRWPGSESSFEIAPTCGRPRIHMFSGRPPPRRLKLGPEHKRKRERNRQRAPVNPKDRAEASLGCGSGRDWNLCLEVPGPARERRDRPVGGAVPGVSTSVTKQLTSLPTRKTVMASAVERLVGKTASRSYRRPGSC